jgi:hypothetical protein
MDPAKAGSLKPVIDLKVGVALAAKRCQTCFFHDRLVETSSVRRLFAGRSIYFEWTRSMPAFCCNFNFRYLNPHNAGGELRPETNNVSYSRSDVLAYTVLDQLIVRYLKLHRMKSFSCQYQC